MSENPVENELNAIRLELYEETKEMTPSEVTAYIKKQLSMPLEEYDRVWLLNVLNESMTQRHKTRPV
jgi:hypothetical protein